MDIELPFKPRLPEADVELPGLGTVRVRGLSRMEALEMKKVSGVEDTERRMISLGMVDPVMTEKQVERWQKACGAGEIEPVVQRIGELSGMLEESAKAQVKAFEADPDAEFRALPSTEAGDDGSQAPAGDV